MNVMVINSSPTVCQVLANALQRRGHQVRCFLDPMEALHTLFQTKTISLPDLLFIHITSTSQLPEYEVLRQFRTSGPQIPVVVICPPENALIKLKAGLAGASAFLEEPVKIQQVVAHAQRIAIRPNTSTK